MLTIRDGQLHLASNLTSPGADELERQLDAGVEFEKAYKAVKAVLSGQFSVKVADIKRLEGGVSLGAMILSYRSDAGELQYSIHHEAKHFQKTFSEIAAAIFPDQPPMEAKLSAREAYREPILFALAILLLGVFFGFLYDPNDITDKYHNKIGWFVRTVGSKGVLGSSALLAAACIFWGYRRSTSATKLVVKHSSTCASQPSAR